MSRKKGLMNKTGGQKAAGRDGKREMEREVRKNRNVDRLKLRA